MIEQRLRVPPGRVDLSTWDPRSTPGYDGDKAEGKARLVELANIVIVPKNSPYRTLQELLAKARS